jgi:hypothetical protein
MLPVQSRRRVSVMHCFIGRLLRMGRRAIDFKEAVNRRLKRHHVEIYHIPRSIAVLSLQPGMRPLDCTI